MRLLLDTNAYVALRRGHAEVAGAVRRASRVYLSAIVVGELMHGFHGGTRAKKNVRELEELAAAPYVELLPVTWETADRFGRIAADLRRGGRPIPTNDVWIAAHAMQTGAELLTADAHFDRVPGLALLHFSA